LLPSDGPCGVWFMDALMYDLWLMTMLCVDGFCFMDGLCMCFDDYGDVAMMM